MGSGSVSLLILFFEQLEGFSHQLLNFLVIFGKSAVPFLQVIAGLRQRFGFPWVTYLLCG